MEGLVPAGTTAVIFPNGHTAATLIAEAANDDAIATPHSCSVDRRETSIPLLHR